MTVKERLKEFIKHKGMSVRSFESGCGLSYGYVNNMRVSIQPDKVGNIARCFPELNTGWLLTGEGEMLKGAQKAVIERDDMIPVSVLRMMDDERKRFDDERKRFGAQLDELLAQQRILVESVQSQTELLKKDVVLRENNAGCAAATGSDK